MNAPVANPSFSQFGEDLLVLEFFAGKTDGVFVEVDANDPENLLQTLLLEQNGWRGILVEPQSDCCEKIRRCRPLAQVFQVACGSPEQCGSALLQLNSAESKLATARPGALPTAGHEEVRVMTLDEILAQAGTPKIDFLSIDVEGFELDVLRGFNLERHQPQLLLLEDNFPNRLKVHRHMKQHGYRLVKRTGCNNWYIPQSQPFNMVTNWERVRLGTSATFSKNVSWYRLPTIKRNSDRATR